MALSYYHRFPEKNIIKNTRSRVLQNPLKMYLPWFREDWYRNNSSWSPFWYAPSFWTTPAPLHRILPIAGHWYAWQLYCWSFFYDTCGGRNLLQVSIERRFFYQVLFIKDPFIFGWCSILFYNGPCIRKFKKRDNCLVAIFIACSQDNVSVFFIRNQLLSGEY